MAQTPPQAPRPKVAISAAPGLLTRGLRPEDSRRDFDARLTGPPGDRGFDDVRESLR